MAQTSLTPVAPPVLVDGRLSRRTSIASLTARSDGRGRTRPKIDKTQQQSDEEDVGQGIIVLYDKLAVKDKSGKLGEGKAKQNLKTVESSMIDIVAVPGLEAHPVQTWIKRRRIANLEGEDTPRYKDGPSCIADPTMLPDVLPNSRIMTFSYASDWRGIGKSDQHQPVSNRIEAVADVLLRELKRLRKNCSRRPIILLGHSLGGIIVEKTVVKSKVKSEYLEIYNSIAGCVFLGAPFKGSESQAKAALAAKAGAIINAAEYTPLLELMKKDSQHLADLLADFLDIVNEAKIQTFCFYELQKSDVSGFYRKLPIGRLLPPQEERIADEKSSTLEGKDMQGLNRNHFDLNKFESNRDREWLAVSSVIERMASKSSKALKDRRNALPEKLSSERYLEMLTTLAAMEADPESDIKAIEDERGQAIADTANLVLENEKVKDWFDKVQNGVLWISLNPGMNSAMMTVAMQRQFDGEIRVSQLDDYLCYFFCDSNNVRKNNTLSVLKAFIRQLLTKTQRLALHLPYEQQRVQNKKQTNTSRTAWDSFANLRLAFLAILKDPLVNSVTLIVDSLHKIDEDTRVDMLELIEESLNVAAQDGSPAKVRWICFGLDRPDISSRMQQALKITAEDLGTKAEFNQSLKSLVRNRVLALSQKLGYSREYTFWLRTELLSRAEGNTTWVDLACGEIESVRPKYIDVRSFAERLRQDLNPLYRQIQARVLNPSAPNLEYTKEMLRTMLISFHNPTMQELAVLSGLPTETWNDVEEIQKYLDGCGSFLKLVSGKRKDRVHFMDTTASEFLNHEAASDLGHHGRLSIQHGIIALRCLNFMMNANDDDHPASEIRLVYPKRFWLNHAQKASEELPDLIEDFDLHTDFWEAGGFGWWPKLNDLTSLWPNLNNLTVIHLAAYFNFPTLLDQLLAEDSVHKDQIDATDSIGCTPMYWAAYEGNFEIVQTLASHSADVNTPLVNGLGFAPLHGAAEKGHIEIVNWLLEHGAIIDVPNDEYGTALCCAASNGHTDIVTVLLRAGASKVAPPKWFEGSALTAACYRGYPETAKFLIKEKFDVNIPDKDGVYALQGAVQCEDAELFRMLLDNGVNLDSRQGALDAAAQSGFEAAVQMLFEKPTGLKIRDALVNAAKFGYATLLDHFPKSALMQQDLDMALYVASDMEQKDTVEKLLAMGGNADAEGEEYGNALQAAAWDGSTDIIKLLVQHGAKVNEVNGTYGTALQAAAFQGDQDNIRFLIASGARVNAGPDGKYGNALYAAVAGNSLSAVKILVEHGANVNAKGGELDYALLEASSSANFETIEYLLGQGAEIHCKTDDNSDVLLLASSSLPKENLQYLCDHGSNIHTANNDGKTVLIGCAHHQDMAAVEWLMELDVDINAVSIEFGSALQAAAAQSNELICEVLLKHGANPNQTDDNHPPPLLKAAELGDDETFDMLLKHGADVNYTSEKWGNLVEAAVKGTEPSILGKVLKRSGYDVDKPLRNGETALCMAARDQSGRETFNLLLKRGANPNIVGGKYHTPLQAGAYKGFTNVTDALLKKGADKTAQGGFYGSAANAAAANDYDYLLERLLGRKGGPATDEALHYAIHYHANVAVQKLIDDLKADVTSKGEWGNVFQALGTSLTEDEINSDDDDEEEQDQENDDEDDDGEEADELEDPDVAAIIDKDKDEDDDEDEEGEEEDVPELTDEEKVEAIDEMLKSALEGKDVNPETLSKTPLGKHVKLVKAFAKIVKKDANAKDRATAASSNNAPGKSSAPAAPSAPVSSDQNSLLQAQKAGEKVGKQIRAFWTGLTEHTDNDQIQKRSIQDSPKAISANNIQSRNGVSERSSMPLSQPNSLPGKQINVPTVSRSAVPIGGTDSVPRKQISSPTVSRSAAHIAQPASVPRKSINSPMSAPANVPPQNYMKNTGTAIDEDDDEERTDDEDHEVEQQIDEDIGEEQDGDEEQNNDEEEDDDDDDDEAKDENEDDDNEVEDEDEDEDNENEVEVEDEDGDDNGADNDDDDEDQNDNEDAPDEQPDEDATDDEDEDEDEATDDQQPQQPQPQPQYQQTSNNTYEDPAELLKREVMAKTKGWFKKRFQ